jgi:hypothetical protein
VQQLQAGVVQGVGEQQHVRQGTEQHEVLPVHQAEGGLGGTGVQEHVQQQQALRSAS